MMGRLGSSAFYGNWRQAHRSPDNSSPQHSQKSIQELTASLPLGDGRSLSLHNPPGTFDQLSAAKCVFLPRLRNGIGGGAQPLDAGQSAIHNTSQITAILGIAP